MGGRESKQKGNRAEYQVRDYFRGWGYKADRVPSSGAAQGFPGDVKVFDNEGNSFLVEVKSRQKSFTSIYDLYFGVGLPVLNYHYGGVCVSIVTSFPEFPIENTWYDSTIDFSSKRVFEKILNMQKWLKGASYLVIKDNNRPLLFIRYI